MSLLSYHIARKSPSVVRTCACQHPFNIIYRSNANPILKKQNETDPSRGYSTTQRRDGCPQVMDFPVYIWPNIFKTFKNVILTNLIISKYFDTEFNMKDFTVASKQAVEKVSHHLSMNELRHLVGLVTPDVIAEIKICLTNFSSKAESALAIKKDDIVFSFPYEVGIILPDDNDEEPQKRIVEITMVYHVLTGFNELNNAAHSELKPWLPNQELTERLHVLNYRFRRDFTKGVEPDWIINGLNHFRPMRSAHYS
ncbi:m-AAA protease-interacting protein 1, mitochondrial [Cimex lectularius]|uniref:Uncharacterized protein n=1 Tax=Cimex lectularius TaxID=79782 RepID=A0A8I6RD65_CIMLE|nr:m-AAA protease-interacting protein 1, mitochondrial [Cimex lectularius]